MIKLLNPSKDELQFIVTILEYLDTPQYLRKKIYPKIGILKNVGKASSNQITIIIKTESK